MHNEYNTHEVFNQYTEISDYNLFTTDQVLQDYFIKHHLHEMAEDLKIFGEQIGSEESYHDGSLANAYTPILHSFDNRGNRTDFVEFHPAWHRFMAYCKTTGLIGRGFASNEPFRWSYVAANFMMQTQVEAGALCPATMTLACIPLIQKEPKLWEELKDKLVSSEYDERDIPIAQKKSIWIGMGVTEKQGGSDVRTNTTYATPMGESGRGHAYKITGHKWFFSAPMCDAHLVVAKTTDTDEICTFFVPRWKSDGTKNPLQIQRLKEKLGNKSNSSCEIEFRNAYGILIGEEGRGIPTIMEMANTTRFCCVLGSAGIARQATVQAIAYAQRREAFGKTLYNQPLMRNVLVDMALETEAAQVLALRLAEAFEKGDSDSTALAWKRFMTPASKFWVCKRAEAITAEAMEVFGGNGYIEDGNAIMARLYKESPVNSIWEGSGNVMCLDVLRVVNKHPQMVESILDELKRMSEGDERILKELATLLHLFRSNQTSLESKGRILTEKLMLITQACLLKKESPKFISEAFIELRLVQGITGNFGAFDGEQIDYEQILKRAFPLIGIKNEG
ncbi:MAG: acyl-CoA dehydrogenase family protein [Brumimicrobium sp.]|nr:acyl-CoA dehydrogenase family protein [Brumimicrobium sp.]